MKVKLGEWIKEPWGDNWDMDAPIGRLEVNGVTHWRTDIMTWHCGLSSGSDQEGEAHWVLGEYTDFATAEEAKAFIISEYEKLVLSLIEVE